MRKRWSVVSFDKERLRVKFWNWKVTIGSWKVEEGLSDLRRWLDSMIEWYTVRVRAGCKRLNGSWVKIWNSAISLGFKGESWNQRGKAVSAIKADISWRPVW